MRWWMTRWWRRGSDHQVGTRRWDRGDTMESGDRDVDETFFPIPHPFPVPCGAGAWRELGREMGLVQDLRAKARVGLVVTL